jgi:hypothetical protein
VAEWSEERRKRQSELAKSLHASGKLSGGKRQRKRPDDVVETLRFRDPNDGRKWIEIPVTRRERDAVKSLTEEQRSARVTEIVASLERDEQNRARERAEKEIRAAQLRAAAGLAQPPSPFAGLGGFTGRAQEIRVDPREDPCADVRTDYEVFMANVGGGGIAYFDADGRRIPKPEPSSEFRSGEIAAAESCWASRGAG